MAEIHFFPYCTSFFIETPLISVKVHLQLLITDFFIVQVHSVACLFIQIAEEITLPAHPAFPISSVVSL
jgi:hypothetical protein